MTKASDNVYPRLLISEGGSTATPAANRVTVYAKSDGLLYSKDDAGAETALGGGGGDITTDAAWAAKGDLIVGTANDTAAILTAGANGYIIVADSGETTGLKWIKRFIGVKAYNSGTQQTVSTGAVLTMDSEEFDTDAFHSTSVNTSRLTVPAGLGGYYLVTGVTLASGQGDWLALMVDGTRVRGGMHNVPSAGRWPVSTILSLTAGQYVELYASSSVATVDWGSSGDNASQTTLAMYLIG